MSSTVDVNLLVYWTAEDSPFHEPSAALMEDLTRGPDLLYVFWPVLMSYLRLVTHPGIVDEPLSLEEALENVESLVSLAHVRTPGEEPDFLGVFRSALPGPIRGNDVPDAHLVALMQHGVASIYTNDRGFRRFDKIRVIDPFASP
jgi:uncharacterized protein